MEAIEQVKDLILVMVKSIVTTPEEVEIHISEKAGVDNPVTQINIKVSKPDIKIAIGAGGATAESVRRIASLAAKNLGYEQPISMRVDAPVLPKNHFYSRETAA